MPTHTDTAPFLVVAYSLDGRAVVMTTIPADTLDEAFSVRLAYAGDRLYDYSDMHTIRVYMRTPECMGLDLPDMQAKGFSMLWDMTDVKMGFRQVKNV